jgi:hypothetical protein
LFEVSQKQEDQMANEKNNTPQPYSHDSEGTLIENNGPNATAPYIPNGWNGEFERNTNTEDK